MAARGGQPDGGAPARRSLLPRLLLFALVLGGGTELALRALDWHAGRDGDFYLPKDPLAQGLYMAHPYIGFVLRPGYDSPPRAEHQIHINALGLRGHELAKVKAEGVYRIFCLGGSTTFGTAASGDDATYPAQLERLLNAMLATQPAATPVATPVAATGVATGQPLSTPPPATPLRYEVGNCGVPCYSSAESFIDFALRLVEYAPDAIIIYDGQNDGRIIQARDFLPDYSHMRRAVTFTEPSPLERFLLGHVRTWAWLAHGTDPEDQLGALADHVFVPGFRSLSIPSDVRVNEYGLRMFMRNLRHLIEIARVHGAQPVLCSIAWRSLLHPEPDDHLTVFVARANEELAKLAAVTGVPLIDVDGPLTEHAELFADRMHLNDEGERRHAEVVANEAQRVGLFFLPPAPPAAPAAGPAGAH